MCNYNRLVRCVPSERSLSQGGVLVMSSRNFGSCFFSIIALSVFLVAPASAGSHIVVIDFETEASGAPLVNGQVISSNPAVDAQPLDTYAETFPFVSITTSQGPGGHEGAAIFDSSDPGPNTASGDPDSDLLVNTGNILIFQDNQRPAITDTGAGANGFVFDVPDDEAIVNTGSFLFDFAFSVELLSIDIVDADNGYGSEVIMTDAQGDTRTYTIPENWTFDIGVDGPDGYETLDLTEIALTQPGEGGGIVGLPTDVGSFDANLVTTLEVMFTGMGTTSGGIDNLVFTIPEPTTAMLALFGSLAAMPVFRRQAKKNA